MINSSEIKRLFKEELFKNKDNNQCLDEQGLINYISENNLKFLEDNINYQATLGSQFTLKVNLILDEKNSNDKIKRYLAISKNKEDILGEGTYCKVRRVLGAIDVDVLNKTICYVDCKDEAVKIRNTKNAQKYHLSNGTKYKHSEAIKDFEIHKIFDHVDMQEPIKVKRFTGGFFHKKSYSIMNNFPGGNFKDALEDLFFRETISLRELIESVIIPLLRAYKIQVEDKGYVHRDIKPSNIRAILSKLAGKSIINFLDFDKSQLRGTADRPFGSPGYLPPEVFDPNPIVTPKRDVFALGVILAQCINISLNPVWLLLNLDAKDPKQAEEIAINWIKTYGSYDPLMLMPLVSTSYDDSPHDPLEEFFTYIKDETDCKEVQQEIVNIIKAMTDKEPAKRPDISEVISKFEQLSESLLTNEGSNPRVC